MYVAGLPCARAEWPCELRLTNDAPVGSGGLGRCETAWDAVLAFARSTAKTALRFAEGMGVGEGQRATAAAAKRSASGASDGEHVLASTAMTTSLRFLHVCWLGLCLRASSSSAAEGKEEAAQESTPAGAASPRLDGAFADLLGCFFDVVRVALCDRQRALAAAATMPDAASAPAASSLSTGAASAGGAGAGAAGAGAGAAGAAAGAAGGSKQAERLLQQADRQAERLVLQLMQSVDAFERSSPRQPATAASTPNDAIENVAWAGAADQLLGLLARAACEAQQPVRPPAEMAAAYPPSPNKRGASTAGGRATGPDATAASPRCSTTH